MMLRVVIESPYAPSDERTVEQNVEYAQECLRNVIQTGNAPIASHLLYTQADILDDTNPNERALGIALGLEWARKADLAIFFIDHGMSSGMAAAKRFYKHKGILTETRKIL